MELGWWKGVWGRGGGGERRGLGALRSRPRPRPAVLLTLSLPPPVGTRLGRGGGKVSAHPRWRSPPSTWQGAVPRWTPMGFSPFFREADKGLRRTLALEGMRVRGGQLDIFFSSLEPRLPPLSPEERSTAFPYRPSSSLRVFLALEGLPPSITITTRSPSPPVQLQPVPPTAVAHDKLYHLYLFPLGLLTLFSCLCFHPNRILLPPRVYQYLLTP